MFGLRRGVLICDEALWSLLSQHGILSAAEARKRSYPARKRALAPHWDALREANPDIDPAELAATLYLWANEAWRFRHRY